MTTTQVVVHKSRLLAWPGHTARNAIPDAKILIGGAVLAAIDHEGVPMLRSNTELVSWLDAQLTREHDRAVFDLARARAATAIRPYRPSARSEAAVKDAEGTAERRAASLTAA